MAEVGYASLGIIPSFKGFESKLNSGTTGVMTKAGVTGGTKFGDAAGKQAGSRFGGAFKTAAKASLIGLGALGVGALKLAGDSVKAASDLEESTNKVSQVFGKGAESVFAFSSKAADAMGQTNQQARDAAATFGILGKSAGFADQKNAKFARRMTKLASDLASFSNTSPDEAIDALGAALRGESEPIRKYGVLLDEATLKAEAMSLGILKPVKDEAKIKSYQARILEGQQKYNEAVAEFGAKSIEAVKAQATLGTAQSGLQKATEGTLPPLTQQQKVLAAQSSIFKQTQVAQGDFARTSDGLANQQRRLSARFEDAKARLGKGLLPVMTSAADFILDKGLPAFEDFADWFNKKGIPAIKDFADEVEPVVGYVKDLVAGFKGLPNSTKLAALATVLGGVTIGKVRGGGPGALGKIGSALGVAKGQPVYVTNWAQIAAADGIGGGGGVGGTTGKLGKATSFAGKAFLPVAIVAWSASALKGFWDWNHQKDKNPVDAALGGGKMGDLSRRLLDPNGKADFKAAELEKAAAAYRGINDAASKLPNQIDQGKTAAQALFSEILKVDKSDPKVTYRAPGFEELFARTHEYQSLVDGLNGRTVTTFFKSVNLNKPGDVGEAGTVSGQPPNRSGVTIIHNGNIVANSPREIAQQYQRRARHSAGGGVNIP